MAARPAKRTKLLSDIISSDDSGDEEQDVKLGGTNGFKVNEKYAKRFEHNKKRDERHRLEEKYSRGPNGKRARKDEADEDDGEEEDSEEDESEDDDAELATEDVDDEIFATLQAIKSKDPRLYDNSVSFYKPQEDQAEGADGEAEEKEEKVKVKPMYLQDYHRQTLLAGIAGAEDEEPKPVSRSYQQEQEDMRTKLVGSMHSTGADGDDRDDGEGSGEDNFLVAKSKPQHDSLPTAQAPAQARPITDEDIAAADKDPETYLSNFMTARAWLPTQGSRWQAFDSDDSNDEERADEFEEAYNMRFENPATANEKLQSFARDVGKYSVRRDDVNSRKRARDREREQREQAKREREEERARLRKLKIEDAEEKVKRIKDAAGLKGREEINLEQWKDVIEGDFDDAKWEAEMKRRFDDKYYAEEEAGEVLDEDCEGKKRKVKKPKWDDDIDINDLVPEFEKGKDKTQFTLSSDEEEQDGSTLIPAAEEADEEAFDSSPDQKPRSKKDREKAKTEGKRTARRERRKIEELVDASLPISDTPVTGFRYRETSPTNFGLSARDILFAHDNQLNQYAGLKKMAAFRDQEKKRRDKKRFSKKARLREWRKETFGVAEAPGGGFERVLEAQSDGPGGGKKMVASDGGNVKEGERKKRKRKKGKGKGKEAEREEKVVI